MTECARGFDWILRRLQGEIAFKFSLYAGIAFNAIIYNNEHARASVDVVTSDTYDGYKGKSPLNFRYMQELPLTPSFILTSQPARG